MSVSVSQKFVHFWVKNRKREGTYFIYKKKETDPQQIQQYLDKKKSLGCEVDLGSHFISDLS